MLTGGDSHWLVNVKIFGLKSLDFLYKIKKNEKKDSSFEKKIPGTIVKIPLRNSIRFGLVQEKIESSKKKHNFEIKEIVEVVAQPSDDLFYSFVCKVAKLYIIQIQELYSVFIELVKKCSTKKPVMEKEAGLVFHLASGQGSIYDGNKERERARKIILTSEQAAAVEGISLAIENGGFSTFLLYGVTGSGKTEVYKKLIFKAAQLGKNTILLLPEIGLCEKFYMIFKSLEHDGVRVVRYHSALGVADNREALKAIFSDEPILILGVHLPVFLPMARLGLILVDEEHEQGFCKQNVPKIDSKQMSILRAQIYGIPIVLGSATPSISVIYSAMEKKLISYKLTKKISDSPRTFEVVSLAKKERRINFWITRSLENAIESRLERGEQSIIFINRRGHAFSAQCKSCGQVLECKSCSVSMTIHQNLRISRVICHYCSSSRDCPKICPGCGKEDSWAFKGVGTQKIAGVLEKRFPKARIMRVDLDSSKSKKEWPELSKAVNNGEIDILVGTQSIAKGYHFPNVTLVGVIWADLDFNFPRYDAKEQAIQRLLQVSGRAGRGDKSGHVIFQAMQECKILTGLDESKYDSFCSEELEVRKNVGFPPFKKFLQIQIKNKNEQTLGDDAQKLIRRIYQSSKQLGAKDLVLVGPFRPPIYKIAGTQILEVIVKSDSFLKISQVVAGADLKDLRSMVSYKLMF